MEDPKVCPLLLDPSRYDPDTLNLMEDAEARSFWLDSFETVVDKYAAYAMQSNRHDVTAEARAQLFKECFIQALAKIREQPLSYGPLSVRLLLDLKESCLRSQGFVDLWMKQKQLENDASLEKFKEKLEEIDAIENEDEKWIELTRGLLAGNMFDWGAKAISDILEMNADFGLKDALGKIQKRPWLIDNLDAWLQRMKGPSHVCAVVFVDNSGVDIILGVMPFVRQLLLRNTSVILCANSQPALNDTTYSELKEIVRRASKECEIFERCSKDGKLIVMENGQTGPCLDLKNLDIKLCKAMSDKRVDLVIIEGMGRALHTNLHARFNCESLKLAVVKNLWLAKRLGGEIFSVICQYEAQSH